MTLLEQIWTFALRNPAFLVIPAIGFVLSLVIVRIKKRYLNEGVLFGRSPSARRESERSSIAEEDDVSTENHIDLTIALKKIHELAVAEGNLGFEYWYQVGRLLKRATGMQAEIDSLSKELERCRASLGEAK